MKKPIIAPKLQSGDLVNIIAPAFSLAIISTETREIANRNMKNLGLKVTFGDNSEKIDDFTSSSIEGRLEDLHNACKNKEVKAIFSAIGGCNSNQLLSSIDWNLIEQNPKIICGYSDVTVLLNAIYQKTGLVTYYGPHYSTLGQKKELDYTLQHFKKCLIDDGTYLVRSSDTWTDDEWWINQENRNSQKSLGWDVVNIGMAEGIAIGGNISSFSLLKGTEFMPDLSGYILFLEEEGAYSIRSFERELYSLIQQLVLKNIKGIVVGRFQKSSEINFEKLKRVFSQIESLKNIPILVNVDFGHTNPMFTFPIGGNVKMIASTDASIIEVLKH